ncbi:tRNA (N6-threonylcarbamoyladenosine(37)-N6)-methyltransferase TrmO [Chitinimonas sp. BJB300]|uniref:tRNA (N6-threonylcarbamoyladenosine(37)-N6)-methyltransferase TrmO n=1 Tax=Chitinimonas sp. BJB300 TaxID=1559339 RepID=UPI000C0FB95C|nr:tRNA (N6-threonylcarbamoyladenosine(37)-N6)-methyltransferase TrmO [Chitinimonas sp. BJB300]PHV10710.1 tRNA (N6-threonylcarbamoyladenosine(37)-N6)-methyltransferase TrmO [Chitinimonas sp. BJB300]TSJ89781.1 tRNA (N6-threonylcarbamoyladenosine(37)-N6)-methyltransferase TrmO [Chitinimonas sp. BJB300]
MTTWPMQTIGIIESCFKEKFAIPRQPGLSPSAEATLTLLPPFNTPDTVRGLEQFSHVWLMFIFHETAVQGWRATVRPPKLGGNQRIGVFATRSTFRPNPIGLSVAKLADIDTENGVRIHLHGADLLDGTPIIDLKPYLGYADAIAGASNGYADAGNSTLPVHFSNEAEVQLRQLQGRHPKLRSLITEVLAQDPRPGYADDPNREYGMALYQLNIKWHCDTTGAFVTTIEPA